MSERFTIFAAVFAPLIRNGEVFLALRNNTGYKDGHWCIAGSGHIEKGETPQQAAIREAQEESGVTVTEADISYAYTLYRIGYGGRERTYTDIMFTVNSWQGEPHNAEPDKASQAGWFPLNALPSPMLESHRHLLEDFSKGNQYSCIHENEA